MPLNLIPNMPCFMAILKFDLDMTLKWHLLTSNDLQFYLECYNCVLRPRNMYETCATLIFSNASKSKKVKKIVVPDFAEFRYLFAKICVACLLYRSTFVFPTKEHIYIFQKTYCSPV